MLRMLGSYGTIDLEMQENRLDRHDSSLWARAQFAYCQRCNFGFGPVFEGPLKGHTMGTKGFRPWRPLWKFKQFLRYQHGIFGSLSHHNEAQE